MLIRTEINKQEYIVELADPSESTHPSNTICGLELFPEIPEMKTGSVNLEIAWEKLLAMSSRLGMNPYEFSAATLSIGQIELLKGWLDFGIYLGSDYSPFEDFVIYQPHGFSNRQIQEAWRKPPTLVGACLVKLYDYSGEVTYLVGRKKWGESYILTIPGGHRRRIDCAGLRETMEETNCSREALALASPSGCADQLVAKNGALTHFQSYIWRLSCSRDQFENANRNQDEILWGILRPKEIEELNLPLSPVLRCALALERQSTRDPHITLP